MVVGGFLWIDIEGYGGFKMMLCSCVFYEGEFEFYYCFDVVVKGCKCCFGGVFCEVVNLLSDECSLFVVFKQKRFEFVKECEVFVFVIFSDCLLEDMVQKVLMMRDVFFDVYGVGVVKLKDFLEMFFEVIQNYVFLG